MAQLGTASLVNDLLDRVTRRPDLFVRCLIASPFIDDHGLAVIETLGRAVSLPIDVVTRPALAAMVAAAGGPNVRVHQCSRLHAKVYCGVPRRRQDGAVVVSSANLTSAGLYGNVEASVRLSPHEIRPEACAESLLGRTSTQRQ